MTEPGRAWALVVSTEQYTAERLYRVDRLSIDPPAGGPAAGDALALIAATQPQVLFGLARAEVAGHANAGQAGGGREAGGVPEAGGILGAGGSPGAGGGREAAGVVGARYEARFFDAPPVLATTFPLGLTELTDDEYDRLAAGALAVAPRPVSTWLVSVALPIEARSPAEAVREFWTYVDTLGPRELPAYVSPVADELALQAFVLGEEANQDPEQD